MQCLNLIGLYAMIRREDVNYVAFAIIHEFEFDIITLHIFIVIF